MDSAERKQLEGKLQHIRDMLSNMQKNYRRAVQLNNEYNQIMASYQGYEQDVMEQEYLAEKKKMNLKIPIILSVIYTIIATLIRGGYECYLYNERYWNTTTYEIHEAPEIKMTYLQGCFAGLPRCFLKGLIVAALLLGISFLICRFLNWCAKSYRNEVAQKNSEIHKRNDAAVVHNRQCDARIQNLYKEAVGIKKAVSDLQTEYRQYIKGWYPQDMAFSEAVESFLSDISNYRADNMKEAQAIFIQKTQTEILNNNVCQGLAVISNKIDNLVEIEKYNGQLLRMSLGNQEILIKQADAINRNMMMGFTSVNLTNIINTASINRNINSAVNSAVHSINDNVTEGVRSVNRKLDDKF